MRLLRRKEKSYETQDSNQGWKTRVEPQPHSPLIEFGVARVLSAPLPVSVTRDLIIAGHFWRIQMATTDFARTFARLLSDRAGLTRSLLGVGLLVLGGWCFWLARARVTLYEVSSEARVELDAAAYPIQSPLLGRVVEAHLQVGQAVQRGDVLVEVDAAPEQLQMQQETVHAQGLDLEVTRLRSQVAAEQSARAEEQWTAQLSLEEANGRIREAEAAARYADAELAREQKMKEAGLVPPRDLEKIEADARRLRATFENTETAARRLPQEQATRDREREVRIQRLYSEIAALEEQRNTVNAGMQGLKYEVERRFIRAPIDGRIGECMVLRPGSVVEEAESLASIVPSGQLRVVAQFPAEAALGRVQTGQSATLRLDGYPWAEFGSVSATVARVAQEIRDGRVRVELAINPGPGFRGHLEHGMPGTIEVAVERLTPLALVLRTTGQWMTRRP
jgi:multidrug resistance efflux pump